MVTKQPVVRQLSAYSILNQMDPIKLKEPTDNSQAEPKEELNSAILIPSYNKNQKKQLMQRIHMRGEDGGQVMKHHYINL